MQLETVKFTPNDLAKYPFLKDTASYMKKIGLDIEELTSPELRQILDRAKTGWKNHFYSSPWATEPKTTSKFLLFPLPSCWR
jgi:hypothetical protein